MCDNSIKNYIEPWNDPNILSPPVNTFQVGCQIDVQDLLNICNNIIKILSKQSPLHKESALLSRFIYKYDKKFRNDIGYRYFKKLNSALKKYLVLNLLKDMENFTATIPTDSQNYLPTRQMLEYVLVRFMTFSKIMMRIYVCSKQASIYYMDRVKRGESHWMSLMPYSLLSRIWSISTVLLQHSCTWYSRLYPYLNELSSRGMDFLPASYLLPKNIEKWIDMENIDEYGRFEWSLQQTTPITMQLPEDDCTIDTILDYVNEINLIESNNETEKNKMESQNDAMGLLDENELSNQGKKPFGIETKSYEKLVDQGEKITREYFKSFFSNQQKENLQIINHCPDKVTSSKTLDSFITREENYRNESCDLSLTKHLSFMQWQSLKHSLLNLKDSLGNSRKIEKKFKKIWKEKCANYLVLK